MSIVALTTEQVQSLRDLPLSGTLVTDVLTSFGSILGFELFGWDHDVALHLTKVRLSIVAIVDHF